MHTYKSLVPAADCVLFSTVRCNKAVPLLLVYWTTSPVLERMFVMEP